MPALSLLSSPSIITIKWTKKTKTKTKILLPKDLYMVTVHPLPASELREKMSMGLPLIPFTAKGNLWLYILVNLSTVIISEPLGEKWMNLIRQSAWEGQKGIFVETFCLPGWACGKWRFQGRCQCLREGRMRGVHSHCTPQALPQPGAAPAPAPVCAVTAWGLFPPQTATEGGVQGCAFSSLLLRYSQRLHPHQSDRCLSPLMPCYSAA